MPRQPRIEYEGAIYHVMIVEEGLKAAGWSKDQLERERKVILQRLNWPGGFGAKRRRPRTVHGHGVTPKKWTFET